MDIDKIVETAMPENPGPYGMASAKENILRQLGINPFDPRAKGYVAHHAYSMKYRPMPPEQELADFAKGALRYSPTHNDCCAA